MVPQGSIIADQSDLGHLKVQRSPTKLFLDGLVLYRTPSGCCHCLHRPLTLPAGTNSQLHVNLRGVDGPVVGDQVGVVGHTVHVERHHGELHVDDIVVPLLIADLTERKSLHTIEPLFPVGFTHLFSPQQPLASPRLPLWWGACYSLLISERLCSRWRF